MNIRSGLAGLVLGMSTMFGSVGSLESVRADDVLTAEQQKKAEEQKRNTLQQADKLWTEGKLEDALKLYTTLSCKDILGDKVEHVVYDERTKRNNFEELVYQNQIKKEERKAVLFTAYVEGMPASLSACVGLRNLELQGIRKVTLDSGCDPLLAENNYVKLFDLLGVKDFPCYILYSTWDITKGETLQNNSGVIKKIDSVRGGPKPESRSIDRDIKAVSNWVESNLIPSKFEYAMRFNYSRQLQKIYYK